MVPKLKLLISTGSRKKDPRYACREFVDRRCGSEEESAVI
jgi:hypothetical protein